MTTAYALRLTAVSLSLWLALVGAGVLISLTPGAGAINTMSNAMTSG